MKTRQLGTAGVVLVMAGLLIGPAASAAPRSASETDPIRAIAEALARGDGRTGAQLICTAGYAADPVALGHSLSTADNLVMEAGATDEHVRVFADGVDQAYRTANVFPTTAGGSFTVGLSDMAVGYGTNPDDPGGWLTGQAAIGSNILLRAVPSWLATPVPPTPPCGNT